MPWRFDRSKRRLDAIEWRQQLKRFVLNGGRYPLPPETLQRQDIDKIRMKVWRLYGPKPAMSVLRKR